MYLHAGNGKTIRKKKIIGIFDMDTATMAEDTRNFLRVAEKNGLSVMAKKELPKSFILSDGILTDKFEITYSQISSGRLVMRANETIESE